MPTLETNDHVVSYDVVLPVDTQSRPVLLLHSSAAGRWQWRGLHAHLGQGRPIVAPDLIGYGRTEDRSGRPFSMDREVAAVAAVADTLSGPLHVVGHSYGGCVAMAFAAPRPDTVRSLTLIEPVRFDLLRGGPDVALLHEIEGLASDHVRAVSDDRLQDAASAFADYWSGAGTWDALPSQVRASLCAAMAKVAQEWGLLLHGAPEAVSDWRGPMLLIEGTRTTPAARAVMVALASRFPAARRERVAGAGHLSPITHTASIASLIARFLEAHD
ncbi:alpha/beta fold hydrolase [Jannaschia formosa]|uniref:alpha/beta fold hydrolase n=1 Tax=Jannaschia formosa TaxID=2259592 RepID=UPI000E1C2505|nr:alpha/beta fold hydrolase [Jannaschia formosa]TFL16343.1 alpha/beta fold hydrolase [Jannaschia formosa]